MTTKYQASISALLEAASLAEQEKRRSEAERERTARQALADVLADLFTPDWFAMFGMDPQRSEYEGDRLVCRGKTVVDRWRVDVAIFVWNERGVIKANIEIANDYRLQIYPQRPTDLPEQIGKMLLGVLRNIEATNRRMMLDRRDRLIAKISQTVNRGTTDEAIRQIKGEIDGLPVDMRQDVRRRLAQEIKGYVLRGRREQRRREADSRAAQAQFAELRTLAQEFAGVRGEWDGLAMDWANYWTEVLWEPSKLWLVRYVPTWPIVHDDSEYIVPVVTSTDPHSLTSVGADVLKISASGYLQHVVIGAFLDAIEVEPVAADITTSLNYHRHYRAGRYVVNVPAHIHAEPTPFAILEPQWVEFVRERNAELEELAERRSWQSLTEVADDQA